MKTFYDFFIRLFQISILILITVVTYAQTMMPLPPHSSVYSGIFTRGYNFTAPVNMTITGVKVAPEAGSGLQYIHVMKCNTPFPISSGSASTNFSTLAYISGGVNNTIQSVNITVTQGDIIGILGTVTGICNSYTVSSVFTSTIGSNTVYLNRMGFQGSIESGPAASYWGVANNTSGSIGRIFIYYTLSTPTDAGITSIIDPIDTVCSSYQPVQVRLKNYGPATLDSVHINWSVNGVSQSAFNWTGSLTSGDSTNVIIGNYNFSTGTTYNIQANTSLPNGTADSVTSNDSSSISNIIVKSGPTAMPDTTAISICVGDSVLVSGTLTGSPPWDITIFNGTNSFTVNNITLPLFSMYFKPIASTTYTVSSLSDATGCVNTSTPPIVVSVLSQPPSYLSTLSSSTFCEGDSVILQANTGAGLTYQWEKDGILQSGTDSAFVAYQMGAYAVIVSNTAGCDSTSVAVNVTVHPLPVVNLGNDTTIGVTQTITLDAGAGFISYLWSNSATIQTIIIDSTGIGAGTGTFSVTVTDANGCKGTDDIQITFVSNPGIDENQISNFCNIFPNPANDKINIFFSNSQLPANLEIFNSLSMKVFEMKCMNNVEINISAWPRGIYFLMVSNKWTSANIKVVID
ncbi:T9SS type A sorting domain-containing protein [Bacteroidota bacterium]